MDPTVLDKSTFLKLAALVYEQSGIVLGEKKEALVQARIGKRMRQLGIVAFCDYLELVASDSTGTEVINLLDAISTNVTQFFREPRHFELLKGLLQGWGRQGRHRLRVWCAASSTGEEPYSVAMLVREVFGNGGDCRILATDISTRALEAGQQGLYRARDLVDVPADLTGKYFVRQRAAGKVTAPDETWFQVTPELRHMVTFARLNLAAPPFPMRGPFDVIFCRNVMIYFDNPVRRRLLEECYRLLDADGYLLVGHAESLSGMLSNLRSIEPSVYVRR